ncbi:hypothetical protein SprV_0802623800 [Sparganum proliferum]
MDDRSTAEETGLQLGASNLTDSFAEFLHPDPGTGDDPEGLSTHVQTIARRVYQEFEAVLEAHGPAVLEPLMPIMVNVLEKLDELFKDQFAYRAEVTQLREDKASLVAELEREKTIRKDAEDRLLSAEDQFEDERKTLNEALLQNETLIKQLELKSQNALDQLARMEKREADSSNENSKLHGRIDELLRSNLELADNLKNAVNTPIRPTPPRPSGNAFDTTSGGVGFDELSANEGDISPCEDELTDDFSATVPVSEFEPSELAGMQKEIDILIQENIDLRKINDALNVVKDDLLNERDKIKTDNQVLLESVKQLSTKCKGLQEELTMTDQRLHSVRGELDTLKSTYKQQKKEEQDASNKRFTKSEMARLVAERNQYKERFLELQEAIRLTETLRASQRGHPELLTDLPSVSHVTQGPRSGLTPTKLANLLSLPRLDFASEALSLCEPEAGARVAAQTSAAPAPAVSSASSGGSQAWIKLYQSAGAAPVFGWVRGFGRSGTSHPPPHADPALDPKVAAFRPQPHPVPKRCRSIGGANSLRIELTTALAVPSPVENDTTEYLWLIGRGPSLQASPSSGRGTKLCGKVYLYDPLQLYEPLGSLDLLDDFLPLCAGYFTAGLQDSPIPGDRQSKLILSDCVVCCQGNLPSNTARVIVASSDGRFVICGSSPRPKSASQTQTFDLLPLVTFRLANAGESAASLVSLDHRVCLGVVNSTGSNQLVTLKWHLSSEAAASTSLDDAMLNAQLGTNAQSLPGASGAPSGPIIMSTIYETFFWLGTAGGGTLHCFDLSSDDFVSNLSLPPDSPCLHAVAVGPAASASEARLIWLAVSGSSQVSLPHLDEKTGPPCGPHSRLLSVCSSRRVFLHCVDLTALLVSRIDMSDVVDPVDLTVCRLFVQGDECIWFATRCGLIGRFFHNYLLNHESSDAPVDRKDSVSLSCHGYKRPVSALIPIGHVGQDSEGTPVPADRRTPANTPHSLLVVAVGHDYVYLHTTTTSPASFPSLDSTTSRRSYKLVPGAHAIVWSLPES